MKRQDLKDILVLIRRQVSYAMGQISIKEPLMEADSMLDDLIDKVSKGPVEE